VNWDEASLVSLKKHLDQLDALLPEWLHLSAETGKVEEDNPARLHCQMKCLRIGIGHQNYIAGISVLDGDRQNTGARRRCPRQLREIQFKLRAFFDQIQFTPPCKK